MPSNMENRYMIYLDPQRGVQWTTPHYLQASIGHPLEGPGMVHVCIQIGGPPSSTPWKEGTNDQSTPPGSQGQGVSLLKYAPITHVT